MDIPALQENGELPPGEHSATVDDVEAVFGSSTGRRKLLMRGLRAAIADFELSGVRTLWINGSFTTDKNEPNDIDGCWEYTSDIDIKRLDPVFLGPRKAMKKNMDWISLYLTLPKRKAAFRFLSFSRLIERVNRKALLLSG